MKRVPVLILGLLGACARNDDSGGGPAAEAPVALDAPGPWAVGYAGDTLTWADPVGGAARTLRLAWWFPAAAPGDTHPTYAGLWPSEVAWSDAAPAAGPFPLAVFSHGHQGYAENSSFLMEHLASHGWVVVAPDHLGNTVFDGADRTAAIYAQRPLDIRATLDHALALPDGHPLLGRVTGPAVAFGHSFGGYTVLALAGATYDVDALSAACADGAGGPECTDLDDAVLDALRAGFAEPRLAAVVAMAPGDADLFGAAGLAAATVPVFHQTASEDQPEGSVADLIWEGLGGAPHLRLVLEGGGHQSFTDYADLIEDVPLDREEGFRIVDAYGLAWALAASGSAAGDAVLAGETVISDAATLRRAR